MSDFVTLPNLITSGNLAAGFLALLTVPSSVVQALVLVLVAAVLDSVDGPLARRRGKDQTFGAGLDSLADMVSFGVVPALALSFGLLGPPRALTYAVCLGFVLCGAWRLARFPLVKGRRCFVGLPIPVAGVLVMALMVSQPAAGPALLVTAGLSALMVSTLPFPTVVGVAAALRSVARRPRARRSARRQEPTLPTVLTVPGPGPDLSRAAGSHGHGRGGRRPARRR